MANQECPKCKAVFSTDESSAEGWAKSAIATLMPAPAVPDMATQVRCPECGYVFGEGEVRYERAAAKTGTVIAVWLVILGLILFFAL